MSHQSQNPPIWWQKLLFRFFIKRFDAIKVSNPYEKEQLIKLGVNPNKIHYIPITIDHKFFSKKPTQTQLDKLRKKYKIKKTDKLILFVATARSQKKVYTMLKAINLLLKKQKNIKFVFIGKDSLFEEKLPSIKDFSTKIGIKNNVILTGRISNEELRDFMHLADVGITNSSREGQCISVYEKAAANLPLCLSNIGSFTSVFTKSALFNHPDDYKTLAKNIDKYLNNKELVKKHTKINYQLVKERCDYNKIKKQLKTLFLAQK